MTRRKREQLRTFSEDERTWLERISRSQSEPSSHVVRAKQLLAVADGLNYQDAAKFAGIKSGDVTSKLVGRYNQVGLEALQARHGGGSEIKYGPNERERILKEFRRKPVPEIDGTATWSLKTLRTALQKASDGLPEVSEDTIRTVLLEHGYSWQQSRTWCETGTAVRKRKRGKVIVTDPDTVAKKT